MNRLLENQLEEERQLSYSFGSSMNDKQNINAQEAKSTEEIKMLVNSTKIKQQKILKIEIERFPKKVRKRLRRR